MGILEVCETTRGYIPFPIVRHKRDHEGGIVKEFCSCRHIKGPEFIICVTGLGIPVGDLEDSNNVSSGLWYHVPRDRVRPGLGGCYQRDFVDLDVDSTFPGGGGEDLKVFASAAAIQRDCDAIDFYEPDTRLALLAWLISLVCPGLC